MADTGWVTVGTGANNADAGNKSWNNTSNITTASDASYSTTTTNLKDEETSQYLHGTNCDFSSIPEGSTIDGVGVLVRRCRSSDQASGGNMQDHTIQLLVGGVRTGDNKAVSTAWGGINNVGTAEYGGASDLWGLSLSRSEVIASNFGLAVRAYTSTGSRSPQVFYIQIKVHYTEAAGNTGAFFALFNVKDRLREIMKPKKKFWLPEPRPALILS